MSLQLPLGLQLNDYATFGNYVAGANELALKSVQACAAADREGRSEPFVYLWGGEGSGKTHLLQSACHLAPQQGGSVFYLPLQQAGEFSVEMLQGLECMGLICIDDLQAIAGQRDWEQALFHLYNRVRDQGNRMIVTAATTPSESGIQLPDLISRLSWGGIFHLSMLEDEQKLQALQSRAGSRGFELPRESGRYLLRRYPRDMHALFALLDRLDEASLAAQRRLTIPFIRETLAARRG